MSKGFSLEKSFFVLSFAALTFLYGFAACAWGLFPKRHLLDAWGQAKRTGVVSFARNHLPGLSPSPPSFLHPQVYDREGGRIVKPKKINPGLTLITSVGLDPELKLIDRKGGVVHSWQFDVEVPADSLNPGTPPGNVHGSHLLPNGDLLINLAYDGTLRLDACGRLQWKVPGGHHSVERAENGTFWVSAVSEEPQTGSKKYPNGFPGIDKPVYLDRIRNLSKDGRVIQTINVLDILYSNSLQRYIPKSYLDDIYADVTHLNDVEALDSSMADEYPLFEGGDLVVSLRHLNLVFVFDPESRKVKWHASSPFIRQHDPDFMGNGWIGVFDNRTDFTARGKMLGGSRIVAMQPHTDSTKVLFPTPRSDTFYTEAAGNWQKLANGNLLLTETQAGRVVEVAPDGSTVWEWVHEPSENSKVPEVTEGTRYDLTRDDIASWPCSSVDSIDVTAQKQQTAP